MSNEADNSFCVNTPFVLWPDFTGGHFTLRILRLKISVSRTGQVDSNVSGV
ncbi:Uncharacterised protein [Serratia liquefaciens]|jgi:hypothetical protein|nr:hypothetical protein [Serratia sp. BIGb0234]CAI2421126.1 Uncharacterised protein [Serratia liquefaciens]CAI2421496.1 Uncharacterised protein [Serratia liquefaciens]